MGRMDKASCTLYTICIQRFSSKVCKQILIQLLPTTKIFCIIKQITCWFSYKLRIGIFSLVNILVSVKQYLTVLQKKQPHSWEYNQITNTYSEQSYRSRIQICFMGFRFDGESFQPVICSNAQTQIPAVNGHSLSGLSS